MTSATRPASRPPSVIAVASRSRSTSTRRSSLPDGDLGIASISSQARSCMWGATRAGDERHDLVRVEHLTFARDDERLRHFTGLLVADGHHAGVGDLRVREQDALQLRGRHLVALVFDQFLEAIDDAEAAALVDRRDVAGAQPAVARERGGRGALVAEVAEHDLRPAHPDLARRAARGVLARLRIDEPRLGAREQRADRAVDVLVVLVRVVGDRARLGEAVALLHAAADAPLRGPLQLGVQRRRAARDEAQAREVVVVDERMLGQREHDRRRDVAGRDAVLLDRREELREVEARHRDDARAAPQGVVEHERLAVDVEERQDGDHAVVLADRPHGRVLAEVRDEVAVRQHHALGQARSCRSRTAARRGAWPGSIAGRGAAVPGGASSSANGVVPGASPIEKTSSTPAACAAASARSASCGDGHEEAGARGPQLERRLLGRVERVHASCSSRRRAPRRGTRRRTRARWARRSRRRSPGASPRAASPAAQRSTSSASPRTSATRR